LTDTESEPVGISFGSANVFAEGNSIHQKYQRWLLDMGAAHAIEFEVEHSGLRIAGAIDAVLTKEYEAIVEIKSIGIGTIRHESQGLYQAYQEGLSVEDLWARINRPFPSHLRQGFLYLWLLRNGYFMTSPDDEEWLRKIERVVFLYEFKANQQVKEFVATFNQAMIQPILEDAREVTLSVKHGIIPDRPRWAEEDHRDCKACPYRKVCWSVQVTTTTPVKRAPSRLRRKALGRTANG
jgi:CRISPR/Cas system-associated exonuclease Cas4 (RecB family)